MSRFVQGADRRQPTLLPECLDDYVAKFNLDGFSENRSVPAIFTGLDSWAR